MCLATYVIHMTCASIHVLVICDKKVDRFNTFQYSDRWVVSFTDVPLMWLELSRLHRQCVCICVWQKNTYPMFTEQVPLSDTFFL